MNTTYVSASTVTKPAGLFNLYTADAFSLVAGAPEQFKIKASAADDRCFFFVQRDNSASVLHASVNSGAYAGANEKYLGSAGGTENTVFCLESYPCRDENGYITVKIWSENEEASLSGLGVKVGVVEFIPVVNN